MKRIIFAAFLLLLLVAACSTSKEVVLNLANPQDLSVSFSGYYILESTGDSVPMNGVTPRDYVLALERGDQITGKTHKGGSDMVDTLLFRVLVDDEEVLSQKTTLPSQVIEFTVTAQ
ncbi:MAG TPA: hypothetical protein VF399_09045 [bacterium]